MEEEMEQKEMHFNHSTPQISPLNPKPGFPGYYALIPFVLLILIGCMVAVVVYIRRKSRLNELRHRLIPLYSYDPAEDQDWKDAGREDEEEELAADKTSQALDAFTYRKMGSQRQNSQDVHQLGQHRFLTAILLATALVLPALTLDTLLCYYCPLQHKGKSCANTTSQCLPEQRCSSSRGHYGSIHILSAQGCVDSEFCGSHEIISHLGVKYNVSHTCCCKDKCNGTPKSDAGLKKLLGMTKDESDYTNITNGLREEPWDSCANYTSLRTATLPASA
ncbi:uncharacterized protein LOC120792702 isoform X2 [Xiphias gladius]|uniref:uncharacterized protein LOC120792702 isoform X2 n=1 Tax=Xiphias gladius TaxID=8245 RepID=UPI001A99FEC1|nr:uncharacterized protein LOC120792702 isoform X2 [Xiphias gladius]